MEASTAEDAERVPPPRTGRPVARAADSPSGGIAAYAAEFLGTLMLVLVVAMVVIVSGNIGATDWAVIGLVHVFVLMLLVMSLGGASGAHFNPAVTIALALGRKIRPPDAAIYIVVQILGAIVGAFIAKLLLDDEGAPDNINYGAPAIAEAPEAPAAQPGVPPQPATGPGWLDGKVLGGMFAELIGTFFLMWAVMATAVNPRGPRNWAGFVIGATLGTMVMIIGPLTGAGLNPARSIGPGIVGDGVPNLIAYGIGPIVGAILAYALYTAIVLNPQGRDPGDRPIDHLD